MTIDKILFRLSKEIIESNTDNPYLLGIPKRGDLLAQRISNNLLSENFKHDIGKVDYFCLLYTSPSPRDGLLSRMPSSA